MSLTSTEIKKNIIHTILDFSMNVEAHRSSVAYSMNQVGEMLALAIEINNLINFLDKDHSRFDANLVKPELKAVELKKIQRVLELVFKYNSDLNSVSIDIGENLSNTNRYLQRGVEYIFENLPRKSYIQQPVSPQPSPQARPRQQAVTAAPRKKSVGLMAPLMFLVILGIMGSFIYNMIFDKHATQVTSLVKEYRSDKKLSSVARPSNGGSLKVQGTNSVLNIVRDHQDIFIAKYPGVVISIEGGDSGVAINDVMDDKVGLAASSRIPSVSERKKSIKLGNPIADHKVALDSVVVFTHKNSPLDLLSVEDLKKIYNNEEISWKEITYNTKSPQQLTRFSLSKQSGTYGFFMDRVMFGEAMSEKIIHVYNPKQMVQMVAANPSAIGFCSLSALMGETNDVKIIPIASVFNQKGTKPIFSSGKIDIDTIKRGEYPLTRYLYLVSGGAINDAEAKLIDFVRSSEMQGKLPSYGLVGIY